MGRKAKFTDTELIVALNQTNFSPTAAAEMLGVTHAAVIKRRDQLPEGALITREEWDIRKVDAMKDLQRLIVASITQEDIQKSSAAQRVTMAAILEDKIRLAEGKATEHIAHVMEDNISSEFKEEIKNLIKKQTEEKRKSIVYEEDEEDKNY